MTTLPAVRLTSFIRLVFQLVFLVVRDRGRVFREGHCPWCSSVAKCVSQVFSSTKRYVYRPADDGYCFYTLEDACHIRRRRRCSFLALCLNCIPALPDVEFPAFGSMCSKNIIISLLLDGLMYSRSISDIVARGGFCRKWLMMWFSSWLSSLAALMREQEDILRQLLRPPLRPVRRPVRPSSLFGKLRPHTPAIFPVTSKTT